MRLPQRTGTGAWHWRHIRPNDPALKPIGQWRPTNRAFYVAYREWLLAASYSASALNLYCVAARLAFGLLDQPYWLINPDTDFDRVRTFIDQHYPSASTREGYRKGLAKLEEYWRSTHRRPRADKTIHWDYYLDGLPDGLGADIQRYLMHRRRSWRPEEVYHASLGLVGPLTRIWRGIAHLHPLATLQDLTPARWFEYVDVRLAAGILPITLNAELGCLKEFLRFLAQEGQPIAPRILEVDPLKVPSHLPRDLPVDQLRLLQAEIERDASSPQAGVQRLGVMDAAWFLLMLHCGLRTGEVRRLGLSDVNVKERKVRIEQSKGLRDRVVYLSPAAVHALEKYLKIRGPAALGVDHIFLYRHRPLSSSYIGQRLRTYGERCKVKATPHQLRHSCATLLLNAGAPILTVQAILGHQHVDTTLGYARLYDGTVAADYYRAMALVEDRFAVQDNVSSSTPSAGELLAMVDALRNGTLSASQIETLQALCAGILAVTRNDSQPRPAALAS